MKASNLIIIFFSIKANSANHFVNNPDIVDYSFLRGNFIQMAFCLWFDEEILQFIYFSYETISFQVHVENLSELLSSCNLVKGYWMRLKRWEGETVGNDGIACIKVIVTVYLLFLLFCKSKCKCAYLECWLREGMLILLSVYTICYDLY